MGKDPGKSNTRHPATLLSFHSADCTCAKDQIKATHWEPCMLYSVFLLFCNFFGQPMERIDTAPHRDVRTWKVLRSTEPIVYCCVVLVPCNKFTLPLHMCLHLFTKNNTSAFIRNTVHTGLTCSFYFRSTYYRHATRALSPPFALLTTDMQHVH